MDINIHDVKRIETQITVFENFKVLELEVTDKRGRKAVFKLFAEEIESLEEHIKPLKVAYNR